MLELFSEVNGDIPETSTDSYKSFLQDQSKRISQFMSTLSKAYEKSIEDAKGDITHFTKQLKQAASYGDLRENSEFASAKESLADATQRYGSAKESLDAIKLGVGEIQYKCIDLVIPFSTVLLSVKREDAVASRIVVKIYPLGISYPESHIISDRCVVGALLMYKHVGERFSIFHRITGDPVEFEICGIY